MNSDVFLSILALDSYNRGYGANLLGLAETGKLGQATLVTRASIGVSEQEYANWQNAGFYAIAYNWNGQKIRITVTLYLTPKPRMP